QPSQELHPLQPFSLSTQVLLLRPAACNPQGNVHAAHAVCIDDEIDALFAHQPAGGENRGRALLLLRGMYKCIVKQMRRMMKNLDRTSWRKIVLAVSHFSSDSGIALYAAWPHTNTIKQMYHGARKRAGQRRHAIPVIAAFARSQQRINDFDRLQ